MADEGKAEARVREIVKEEIKGIKVPEIDYDEITKRVGGKLDEVIVTLHKHEHETEIPPKAEKEVAPLGQEGKVKLSHKQMHDKLGFNYCPYCEQGEKLGETKLKCVGCGSAVTEDMKRCPTCGNTKAQPV